MTDDRPSWDDMKGPDRARHIRRQITILRRAWPAIADPIPTGRGGGARPVPASRIPTNVEALSLRAEIEGDAVFWVGSIRRERKDAPDLVDRTVPGLLAYIADAAMWAAGWSFGRRLAYELEDHAAAAARFAWPHDDRFTLGACTNTVGRDGVQVTCGATVRAKRDNPGSVKCPGCGLVDTIDGWLLRIVGDAAPVTAEQLVPILHKRMGVTVKPSTIRQWKSRGEIVAVGTDERGRDLFDRHHAMLVVTRREARAG